MCNNVSSAYNNSQEETADNKSQYPEGKFDFFFQMRVIYYLFFLVSFQMYVMQVGVDIYFIFCISEVRKVCCVMDLSTDHGLHIMFMSYSESSLCQESH